MMQVQSNIEALADSLNTFVALLQQESVCLEQKNADALAHTLDEKNRLTTIIGDQWEGLCQSLGLPVTSHAQVEDRIVEQGDRTLNDAWRVVSHLSQKAKTMNEQNGALIRLQLLQTNKAIEVLQAASRQNSTYGPDGRSDGSLSYTRTIDKA